MAKPSVCVAIPSGDVVQADFAFSLAKLIAVSLNQCEMTLANGRSSCAETSRNQLVGAALEAGSDYVLWIDSDMVFPSDSLSQLLAHNVDFVGVNYVRREYPHGPLCEIRDGLYEVDRLGFGLVLMRTEVIRRIEVPRFNAFYSGGEGLEHFVSSDTNFCRKARAAGYKIWCDGELSKQIGHVATRTLPLR